MITNYEIAALLKYYSELSELHDGNPFKIKSYQSASFRIDRMTTSLDGLSIEELIHTEGVGKSLASKIYDITQNHTFQELDDLIKATPTGVLELFKVKGIGPKKIAFIWKNLGIESVGELLYACKENRLAQAKGFGVKTQQSIQESIEFIFENANKFHYSKVEPIAQNLIELIGQIASIEAVSFTGDLRRKCEVLEQIDIIICTSQSLQDVLLAIASKIPMLNIIDTSAEVIRAKISPNLPVFIYYASASNYGRQLFLTTASQAHLNALPLPIDNIVFGNEIETYASMNMDYIEPEMREGRGEVVLALNHQIPNLIKLDDLKGILHNHTTYSDGTHSLSEMATYAKELGYEYLGICDHSQSAQYAGGLKADAIMKQHEEIDILNQKLAPFKIFKGIESDILGDGNLDYEDSILKSFDFIVASIHSNLKMTEEKAMTRLIRAIENPYTTILGHPTGRLLLMREGYPINHQKIIDACASNGVAIEINANPYRLDLDWRYIDYALSKNVQLSINPDAHEMNGYHDMYFGVCVARKGGLTKDMCLNAKNLNEIAAYFNQKR
jgi:DNA polymerase (family 10)